MFIIMAKTLNARVKYAMRCDNLKEITLPQYNSHQIISQYIEDTSSMVKAEKIIVDNLVGILHKFGMVSRLKINWHKNVAYRYG